MRDVAEILEHWYAGRSVRAIGNSLGVDRKTVRKYVALAEAASFAPGRACPSEGWGPWLQDAQPDLQQSARRGPARDELDSFRDEILQVLQTVGPTTAWRRLRRERGLKASLASFRRYLHTCLPEVVAAAHVTPRRPDPPPGEEAQVDYGTLGRWFNSWGQKHQLLHLFALVLSYSRHMFVCAVPRMDQPTWLQCHVEAFQFFGGAPRRVVLDNLKAGVLRADIYDPSLNRGYEELAHHYGFLPDPARGHKPKDKPRVERMVPFIRNDFWPGRSFASLNDINVALQVWCLEEAGLRTHGTTGQRPLELFQTTERSALRPLPDTPFQAATWLQAKVARDCHIQVAGSWYSVPYQHSSKTVSVRMTSRLVECYLSYRLIKTHLRVPKGQRSTDWNDYPPEKIRFFQETPDWCHRQARALGPSVYQAVEAVLEGATLHYLRQAQGIIRLAQKYGPERLDAACARAIAFGDPGYRTIKQILERGLDMQPQPPPVQQRLAGAFLRGPEALLTQLLNQEVSK